MWMNNKDPKPEYDLPVLIHRSIAPFFAIGEYYSGDNTWITTEWVDDPYVTHWRPLPNEPRKEP